MAKFPHLDDTAFPNLSNANPYQYRNEIDYSRYSASVTIHLHNVPWCGDYDNVPGFETDDERDEWFSTHESQAVELPSMFRLYSDGEIRIPLPIDQAMRWNYIAIDYGELTPGQPIEHEGTDGFRQMFYFIDELRQDSPSTTTAVVSVDWWTTFANALDVSYMMLERGHAPMAEVSAEEFLGNPIERCGGLLAPDDSFGDLDRAASSEPIVFNDDSELYLCVLTKARADGTGWDKYALASPYTREQEYCTTRCFAMNVSSWDSFRRGIAETPWFASTVMGIFIIPKRLCRVDVSTSFTFLGARCWWLSKNNVAESASVVTLDKSKWGYPEQYADIAKMYTHPYAAIDMTDHEGNTQRIHIEDTCGTLAIDTSLNFASQYVTMDAYVLGIGGGSIQTVHFRNASDQTVRIGGRWYDFRLTWPLPVFAIQLPGYYAWDAHAKTGADAALASTYAGSATMVDNAAVQIAANNAILEANLYKIDLDQQASIRFNTYSNGDSDTYQNQLTRLSTAAAEQSAGISINSGYAQAGLSAVSSVANGAMSGFSSGGPAGAAAGAAVGVVNAAIGVASAAVSAETTRAQTALAVNTTQAQTDASLSYNDASMQRANTVMNTHNNNQIINMRTLNTTTNESSQTQVSNSAANANANALRAYNASKQQGNINAPVPCGADGGSMASVNRPFGIVFSYVTQNPSAAAQAGDTFLRYGYRYNRQWKRERWNVMPRFSYWKASEVMCHGSVGLYEGAQKKVKDILMQGVTVWRNPDDIGEVSIYDNK